MFGLTPQERKVILFIIWVWLSGTGIQLCLKHLPAAAPLCLEDSTFGKLGLNSADSRMLEQLPGVGEKLAARIVELRGRLNGFSAVDQLKQVRGLHSRTYDQIKDLVFLD